MADPQLYTNVQDVLRYIQLSDTSEEQKAAIAMLIDPVSRRIDLYCRQKFYASTETHQYDWQDRRRLWLHQPILSVTTLTNGDGQVIPSDGYYLYPAHGSRYMWIDIRKDKGLYFQWSATPQRAITIAGSWGYSATAPTLVQTAANAWIARIVASAESIGVQSKSIGSFSVSYSATLAEMKEIPGEACDFLKGFIFRPLKSMTGVS